MEPAKTFPPPIPGATPGSATPAPVAGGPAPGPAPLAPVATPAAATLVPLFGGHRGGRPRLDGLKAGSPEAADADRKKHAERMQRARERERTAQPPPPLPSALGASAPPSGSDVPGVPAEVSPVVPWQPEMLKQLTDALIDILEETRLERLQRLAEEAKLPTAVVTEIAKDGNFPPVPKKMLQLSAPRVAAKWLNKSGVSADRADELTLAGSLAAILLQGRKLQERLKELIESNQALAAGETKKP